MVRNLSHSGQILHCEKYRDLSLLSYQRSDGVLEFLRLLATLREIDAAF